MDLSIVIPAYNEEARIGASLETVRGFLRSRPWNWEMIVVDDGSSDRTSEVVERFRASSPETHLMRFDSNRGKGRAVRSGVLAARGKAVLVTDADLAAPIEQVDRFREILNQGFDGVIGSRAISLEVERTPLRKLTSRIFTGLVRFLILPGHSDTQCGFKLFRYEAAHNIFQNQVMDGFSFDIEVLYLARLKGYRIAEEPVRWSAQPGSKVRMVQDSLAMIGDIFKIKKLHPPAA